MTLPAVVQGRLSLPVIGSPMFIVSGPELVIAQCKAGIVGSFPALNARPAEVLEQWLQRITTELDEYRARNPDNPQLSGRTGRSYKRDVVAKVAEKPPANA